jgi:hypothetical protein
MSCYRPLRLFIKTHNQFVFLGEGASHCVRTPSTGAPAVDLFSRNAQGVGWRTKPSWYIVATNDQAVHRELERAAASGWVPPSTTSTAATAPDRGPEACGPGSGGPRLSMAAYRSS